MQQVSKVILFFYEKENLPLEQSECANLPSKKKKYFTNELHTKNFGTGKFR
jgi:hypothetical protein